MDTCLETCDDGDGCGEWQSGMMTYYTANEGGPIGAGGRRLKPLKSVAVRSEMFERMEHRKVKIKGYGTFRVDDACDGSGCKDFDVFVDDPDDLEDSDLGEIPIRYKWMC